MNSGRQEQAQKVGSGPAEASAQRGLSPMGVPKKPVANQQPRRGSHSVFVPSPFHGRNLSYAHKHTHSLSKFPMPAIIVV